MAVNLWVEGNKGNFLTEWATAMFSATHALIYIPTSKTEELFTFKISVWLWSLTIEFKADVYFLRRVPAINENTATATPGRSNTSFFPARTETQIIHSATTHQTWPRPTVRPSALLRDVCEENNASLKCTSKSPVASGMQWGANAWKDWHETAGIFSTTHVHKKYLAKNKVAARLWNICDISRSCHRYAFSSFCDQKVVWKDNDSRAPRKSMQKTRAVREVSKRGFHERIQKLYERRYKRVIAAGK
jgi:hypothetical protein